MRERGDPTAHAEMLALREASEKTDKYFLEGHTMFVSLEPCPMCAHAISLMRIQTLYYAAYDVKAGGVDHGARIYSQTGCNHVPEIIAGLCSEESESLAKKIL